MPKNVMGLTARVAELESENTCLRMVLQHAVNYEEHRYTLTPPPPAWFTRAVAALAANSQETE